MTMSVRSGLLRMAGERLAPRILAVTLIGGAALFGGACGSTEQQYGGQAGGAGYGSRTGSASSQDPLPRQRYGGDHAGGVATGDTQAGEAFARWVLEQDPRREYVTDAVMRGDNQLGVKVQPNITRADLNQLMESLAGGMAREFPGRELQVTAFYQSGDKLAEAYYDPRTRQVDVQIAQ